LKVAIALTLALWSWVALGQYGTAPNGYYPPGYSGDIFSGKVTAVDEVTQVITISFDNGRKTETFMGHLQKPCAVPSADGKTMTAVDLPIGTDVTAFFEPKTQKDSGKKVKENSIIGIMFHSWDGHPVKQQAKKMYPCY
jgi:hypothetical protein